MYEITEMKRFPYTDEFGILWLKFYHYFPNRKFLTFDLERMLLLAPNPRIDLYESSEIHGKRMEKWRSLFHIKYNEEQVDYIYKFSTKCKELRHAETFNEWRYYDGSISSYLQDGAQRFTIGTNSLYIEHLWERRLKPCPFCGARGKMYCNDGGYSVCCINTGFWDNHTSEMEKFRKGIPFEVCPARCIIPSQIYIERAVDIWNNRVED